MVVGARRRSRTATTFFFALAVARGLATFADEQVRAKKKARPEGRAYFAISFTLCSYYSMPQGVKET